MSSAETIRIGTEAVSENRLKELVDSRNLIYFFTWRELKVRYKQTALGILWVALQPLVFMAIVQLLILRRIGGDYGVDGVPSYIMLYVGFSVWQYFEGSFNGAINSFIGNQGLFNKIYIPKMIPAISVILSKVVDLLFAMLLLFVLSIIFGYQLHLIGLVMIFLSLIVMGISALGIGLFLGMLNVKYRDVRQVLPFFIRISFLATPIFWPISFIPEKFQPLLYINPAAAGIQTIREALYDPEKIRWSWLWIPLVTSAFLFTVGYMYFSKTERKLVDIV